VQLFPLSRQEPHQAAPNRTPSATDALPISDGESVLDPEAAAAKAALAALPRAVRDGVLGWKELSPAVRAVIEAAFKVVS
jgi:hypothetical protein